MIGGASRGDSPSSWKTLLGDALGFIAVIWSIPIAIVLVGTPIVLVVALLMMAAKAIF